MFLFLVLYLFKLIIHILSRGNFCIKYRFTCTMSRGIVKKILPIVERKGRKARVNYPSQDASSVLGDGIT